MILTCKISETRNYHSVNCVQSQHTARHQLCIIIIIIINPNIIVERGLINSYINSVLYFTGDWVSRENLDNAKSSIPWGDKN